MTKTQSKKSKKPTYLVPYILYRKVFRFFRFNLSFNHYYTLDLILFFLTFFFIIIFCIFRHYIEMSCLITDYHFSLFFFNDFFLIGRLFRFSACFNRFRIFIYLILFCQFYKIMNIIIKKDKNQIDIIHRNVWLNIFIIVFYIGFYFLNLCDYMVGLPIVLFYSFY